MQRSRSPSPARVQEMRDRERYYRNEMGTKTHKLFNFILNFLTFILKIFVQFFKIFIIFVQSNSRSYFQCEVFYEL